MSRRPGFGAAFWAMIAFGFACILAGGIVGRFGPSLFPVHPQPPKPMLGNPPPPR